MHHQRRNAFTILGAGAALLLLIAAAGAWGGYRLNMTRSYPLGLWRIEVMQREAKVGDIIFICPPEASVFELALKRGYLPRGLCTGGTGPLIKKVAAIAGQDIAVDARVHIDGRLLDHSELRAVDGKGRLLPAFAGGVVPAGKVFLYSRFPGSYDSRYFGPVSAAGILGLAKPILTFTP
ncbi:MULTISPECIES: conjugative transfer signal peptidase TraF [unclassified Mesorhizobium]|uniref:conjugative transfer signal peptidase TraF n=1 Tax=unclassified Mesorhizobium TaxID=325217 RepID=UPI001129A197|nr:MULTISPECIES: conjugative transfer signal peptidase TraF [unclassified Mesorhizobium]MBZ9898294.1 conjugative transfer signal peptidase TraF [Mesorhizobium sp. BR1-1-6]TPJ52472.1 conjugative transfer signal peptidase TraF [Mesorhizobium sp. B2-6-4]TPM89445.1 conjugative transfer signal peptidase TraF [Mesorhizobium sp. B2-1-5]TPN30289.1 conjugative transfer signal peptidase TraF [Mesorhizobium sp. B1-1-6]